MTENNHGSSPQPRSGSRDVLRVTGIRVRGRHGVLASERRDGQEFVVDLTVFIDSRRAAATDDLAQTVDYGSLASEVAAAVERDPVDLIETVAERVTAVVLERRGVLEVEVTIHKPEAPLAVPFDDVTLTVRRSRTAAADTGPEPAQRDARRERARRPYEPSNFMNAPAWEAPSAIYTELIEPRRDRGAAPIRIPIDVRAVISLGSNLGDRRARLQAAVDELGGARHVEVIALSPVAETDPVGGPAQAEFLNAIAIVRTDLAPAELLSLCHDIEDRAGRERMIRWGPRTLDLDVIAIGNSIINTPHLIVPHPRAHERAFVLAPWLAVEPSARIPGYSGGSIRELLERAPDRAGLRWRDDIELALPPIEHER